MKLDIYEFREKIKTKKDFELFLEKLLLDYRDNVEDWENITLIDFLDALHAYTIDVDGYYQNRNIDFDENNPTWKVFADILLGAKVYE